MPKVDNREYWIDLIESDFLVLILNFPRIYQLIDKIGRLGATTIDEKNQIHPHPRSVYSYRKHVLETIQSTYVHRFCSRAPSTSSVQDWLKDKFISLKKTDLLDLPFLHLKLILKIENDESYDLQR